MRDRTQTLNSTGRPTGEQRLALGGLGGMSALKADMFAGSEDMVAQEAAMPRLDA